MTKSLTAILKQTGIKITTGKDTIYRLNKALPDYDFNIEEASKCHIMIAKGQDEVAHPLKNTQQGKSCSITTYLMLNFHMTCL